MVTKHIEFDLTSFIAVVVTLALPHGGCSFLLDDDSMDQFQVWLTTGDTSSLLGRQAPIVPMSEHHGFNVNVYRNDTRQIIDGFGASINNDGAYVIFHSPLRHQIMQELFGNGENDIGISYTRICIGASDLMAVTPYTYDDLDDPYDTDFDLEHFTIDKDREFVIPVIREALEINPGLKIMASPWSPPAWMKKNHHLYGGEFNEDPPYMEAFAKYLIKFIQAYEAEGIPIESFSVQNEPMLEIESYSTMSMNVSVMTDFIKNYLGPEMWRNNITAKLLIWDWNWEGAYYPETILNDTDARQYVTGVTWHGYGGDYDTPAKLHMEYPDIGMYFSEYSGNMIDNGIFGNVLVQESRTLFIGQVRSYCKNVIYWSIALDENNGPKAPGVRGCDICRPVLTVPSDGGPYRREVDYYALAHMSKFVKPGAIYVETNGDYGWDDLTTAAFINEDGSTVVVVHNPNSERSASFSVYVDDKHYQYGVLPPQSTVTLVK